MEETKEVIGESKVENPKKMSYEELENVAHQLSEQLKKMYSQLNESNLTNMFKRLDYLFKVAENKGAFSEAFVNKCIKEIEELITLPEENKEEKNNDTKG